MAIISDLIKVLLPALLVLMAMYLTVKSFINKSIAEKELGIKAETLKTLLPLRLQAYERMTLFLERISPNNLLIRLGGQASTVVEFQQLLLGDIREEFGHNLAQQVYISTATWEAIKRASQETSTLVNLAARELPQEAQAMELSKKIFEIVVNQNVNPSDDALKVLKDDFQSLFL
jgi:hypothetical protein